LDNLASNSRASYGSRKSPAQSKMQSSKILHQQQS
jgi:hypothetical protein